MYNPLNTINLSFNRVIVRYLIKLFFQKFFRKSCCSVLLSSSKYFSFFSFIHSFFPSLTFLFFHRFLISDRTGKTGTRIQNEVQPTWPFMKYCCSVFTLWFRGVRKIDENFANFFLKPNSNNYCFTVLKAQGVVTLQSRPCLKNWGDFLSAGWIYVCG